MSKLNDKPKEPKPVIPDAKSPMDDKPKGKPAEEPKKIKAAPDPTLLEEMDRNAKELQVALEGLAGVTIVVEQAKGSLKAMQAKVNELQVEQNSLVRELTTGNSKRFDLFRQVERNALIEAEKAKAIEAKVAELEAAKPKPDATKPASATVQPATRVSP